MINSIGLLPAGISIKNLKNFVLNEEVARSLEYLNIPLVDSKETHCDDDIEESEEIVPEDIIIFCTPNESDVGLLQFHIQNYECTNMFLHHDTYVFSTITDSIHIGDNGSPYVAVSTFENDIMVFDPLVRNPIMPQFLLKGHQDSVLCLEYDGTLFSGSSDSTIAEWDTERMEEKNRKPAAGPVTRISTFKSSMIYSVGTHLYCFDKRIDFLGDVERIKIMEDAMLVSDATGILRHYDLRNVSHQVNEAKVHEDSITGLDVFRNDIYTASLDGKIGVLDLHSLTTKSFQNTNEKLFSLKVHSSGFYVYGGEENELKLKIIEEPPAIFVE